MSQTRQKIKAVIHKYKETLEGLGIHVERIILYGSFVSGSPREDSDIDLIVISKDFKKFNIRERLEILGVAAVRVMKPIEAKGYTPNEIKNISPLSYLYEVFKVGLVI